MAIKFMLHHLKKSRFYRSTGYWYIIVETKVYIYQASIGFEWWEKLCSIYLYWMLIQALYSILHFEASSNSRILLIRSSCRLFLVCILSFPPRISMQRFNLQIFMFGYSPHQSWTVKMLDPWVWSSYQKNDLNLISRSGPAGITCVRERAFLWDTAQRHISAWLWILARREPYHKLYSEV